VLKNIYIWAWGEKLTRDWRKLHSEELYGLLSAPNILRVIKSRKMRWARHVSRIRDTRNAYRILVDKSVRKRPLGNLDVDG
jgi:hypothetical protein